ncbi:MAG: type II toxin-antitoxin system Phd/YefM family antitoxin [Lachnospiraceae bacterium]|nr:type II toxin-antitoxin system Phd/YefM family antitoxin [Lachnospiraceae bacterium]
MTAIKGTTVKKDFKSVCDRAYKGEVFIVSRPREENVVICSEKEYARIERLLDYTKKLEEQIKHMSGNASDTENMYPDGFFKLFGAGKSLGLDEEPEELGFESDATREALI